MSRFENKVALVTGGARGQGAAEARAFVEQGARVVVADVLLEEAEELAGALGNAAVAEHLDVSDETAWQRVVGRTEERWGGVDILVNNAGLFRPAPLADTSLELVEMLWRVNQLGPFLGVRTVSAGMVGRGSGSIVNVSSAAADVAPAFMSAYVMSKSGIRGLTRVAAAELAPHGIRVNAVYPGLVDTPMLDALSAEQKTEFSKGVPLGRMGTAEDVARMVLFLASDDASWQTGADFYVDGGEMVRQA